MSFFFGEVGWGSVTPLLAQTSLDNSLYHLSAYQDHQLIGMVRLVGDGALFFYIQDLIIAPAFQHMGVGKALMTRLEQYLTKVAKLVATIGLFSAQGKEGFYQSFGYAKRTGEPLGFGMCKFVNWREQGHR